MVSGLPFGVPAVDKLVPPAPEGATTLLVNEPGIEAEAFLYQATDAHLEAGRPVVYLTTTRAPSSVLTAMGEHGFDPEGREGLLVFVDAFSALLGAREEVAYPVDDPSDLEQVFEAAAKAGRAHPDAVLVVDALSGLADHASPEALVEALPVLETATRAYARTIALFTRWPYGIDQAGLEQRFQAVIEVGGLEERVTFGQFFQLERVDWAPKISRERHPYKVLKPGGVNVYIPKIVVTGPYNAGKSTFVHAVSDTAVSVDRLGTTVALDHGNVTINGVTADIFGTPGQARFDPILRTVAGQALGVIVLVDATKPDTFERAKELLEKTVHHGIPAIVAANKQDAPGALSPEEVQKRLEPPAHVKVLGCVGQDRASALSILETMNDSIVLRGLEGGATA